MKCEEVLDHLHEWVDGELEARVEPDVSRHIEECARCARQAKAIEDLKRVVRSKVRRPVPPAHLRDRVLDRIAAAGATPARSRWRGALGSPLLRAAAAVGIVAVVFFVYSVLPSSAHYAHADAVDFSLRLHSHYVSQLDAPRWTCASAEEVEAFLEKRFGMHCSLPPLEQGAVCFKGVDTVQFHGIEGVRIYGELEGRPFSMFALPQLPDGFTMKGLWCFCCGKRDGRYLAVCRADGDAYFSMVATDIDREEFLACAQPGQREAAQPAVPMRHQHGEGVEGAGAGH